MTRSKTLYDVPAPAKINLFLHVLGQRADGYHLLQTVFRFIDWYDYLHFDLRSDGQIICHTTLEGVAPADNLVVRAARLLQQATGTEYGAEITLEKNIPAGAGLGGGSSDAATTLIALNRLWQTKLSRQQLMQLAVRLGADVPVFVFGQSAFAEGIGEQLTALNLPADNYLMLQPCLTVSTASIFQSPNLTRSAPRVTITNFTDWLANCKAKSLLPNGQYAFFGQNNLQPVVCAKYQVIANAVAWLKQSGIITRISGSGSCLFAEFATAKDARLQKQKIAGKIHAQTTGSKAVFRSFRVCSGLLEHPLRHWLSH